MFNRNLNILVKKNLVYGLNDLKCDKIQNTLCEHCLIGKITRQPFNKVGHRASRPLELIHIDVCGPFNTPSRNNHRYFVIFIHDFTHYGLFNYS